MRRVKLILAVASMALLLVAFAAPAMAKGKGHDDNNNDNDFRIHNFHRFDDNIEFNHFNRLEDEDFFFVSPFLVNDFGFENSSCPFAGDFEGPVNVLDCLD